MVGENGGTGRLRQLGDQAPVTGYGLADIQSFLDFPAARGDRVDHRHLQVLPQHLADVEHPPGAAEQISALSAGVREEGCSWPSTFTEPSNPIDR